MFLQEILSGLIWPIALIFLMWLLSYLVESQNSKPHSLIAQYECGFEPIMWKKISPSLHFSKVGLIFITFDLEMLFVISIINMKYWTKPALVIIFIWATLWMEFEFKSLNWEN